MAQLSLAQGDYDLAIGYLVKACSGVNSAIHEYWFSAVYAAKGDNDEGWPRYKGPLSWAMPTP